MAQHLNMHSSSGGGADGAIDPVCGMTVDGDSARDRGLHVRHEEKDYFFCGKGCKLDFQEDPARYLAADYQPHM
jgi:YHS domain-containing protein